MTRALPRRRWLTLLLLIGLGLIVGFAATRFGGHAEPAAPAVAVPPAPQPPASRGSSLSVVGGMTQEEAARLGIRLPDEGPPAAVSPDLAPPTPPSVVPLPEAIVSVSGLEEDGSPTAAAFPADVQQAASRYFCLCGCPHRLSDCPCRDQPVGASTMLAHLEKQLRSGASGRALDAAMVDRYGERVIAPAAR